MFRIFAIDLMLLKPPLFCVCAVNSDYYGLIIGIIGLPFIVEDVGVN